MTPDDLCKSGKEHGEQVALFSFVSCAALYGFDIAHDWASGMGIEAAKSSRTNRSPLPVLKRLHAIHNQGHGDAIRGARAKAEGVRAGVPDVFLPVPTRTHAGLYIELKQQKYRTAKDGGLKKEQLDWIDYLRNVGYCVVVAYGWREAARHIENYFNWQQEVPI